jgi:FkbM family methyltransferase
MSFTGVQMRVDIREREREVIVKALKLGITALATAALCLVYYAIFDAEALRDSYHCLTHTRPIYACYLDVPFRADLFGMTYLGEKRNLIDAHILKYGAHEKPELYFLRSVIGGGVFLDVGANTGQHSLFMSRYAKEIHAFEPYEPVLARFREMVKLNGITNVAIHPMGLGSEDAKLPFYEPPPDNQGVGSFVQGWDGNKASGKALAIVNGDRELKRLGVGRIDLVKMDIEGYEKPALEGLRETLIKSRPIIVFELSTGLNNPLRFESLAELERLFPERYGFLVLEDLNPYSGAYRLRRLERVLVNEQHNVVAYPLEKEVKILDPAA